MKGKLILELEKIAERIDELEERKNKCNKRIDQLNNSIVKLNKLIESVPIGSSTHNDLMYAKRRVELKIEDLKSKIIGLDMSQSVLCNEYQEVAGCLLKGYNASFSHFEMLTELSVRTGQQWNTQMVFSEFNLPVGVAIVSEYDDNFEKPIFTEVSIANNVVDMENTNTTKFMFGDLGVQPSLIYENWDWLRFYLYATSGYYTNEKMANLYHEFLDRDRDFAEYLCYLIKDGMLKDEMILSESFEDDSEK